MSKLTAFREKLNLTQAELSEKSGISIRTIQRIEAGTEPKGYTLKSLAKALDIEEKELLEDTIISESFDEVVLKIINISSLPGTFFPPLNIIFPLLLMFIKKEFNPVTKQIVSLQIMWTIFSVILFLLTAFMKNWFGWTNRFSLVVMIVLVLSNVLLILRNTIGLDKHKKLHITLGFSFI